MYASELNTNLGRFLPEDIKLFTITLSDPPHINRRAHTLPFLPLLLPIPIDIFQSSPQPSLPPPSLATSPKLCIMKRRSNNLEQSTGISWRNKKARSHCGRSLIPPGYTIRLWTVRQAISPGGGLGLENVRLLSLSSPGIFFHTLEYTGSPIASLHSITDYLYLPILRAA